MADTRHARPCSQSSKRVRFRRLSRFSHLCLASSCPCFPVFCLFSLPCRLSSDAYASLSMRRASAFWSAVSIVMPTHESCQGMPYSSVPSQLTKARSGLPLLEVGGRSTRTMCRTAHRPLSSDSSPRTTAPMTARLCISRRLLRTAFLRALCFSAPPLGSISISIVAPRVSATSPLSVLDIARARFP